MIREFRTADTERVMQIWLESNLGAHPFVGEEYWRSNYDFMKEALPQAELFVCEEDGAIQGFLGMQEQYLAGIFVEQRYRSRGVGKSLLDHIKKLYSSFSLNVYQKNTWAVEFYLREGLEIASEGVDEDTGEADYEMVWDANQ